MSKVKFQLLGKGRMFGADQREAKMPSASLGSPICSCHTIGTASLLGVGEQEAVQVTTGAATGALCVVCLLLLALVTAGMRQHTAKPPWRLRLAGPAAFLSAAVSLVFQVAPLAEVVNVGLSR
jgi:hypothetical protein